MLTQLIDPPKFCFPFSLNWVTDKLRSLHINDVQWIAGNVIIPPKSLLWKALLYATVPKLAPVICNQETIFWLLKLLWSKHEKTKDSSLHGAISKFKDWVLDMAEPSAIASETSSGAKLCPWAPCGPLFFSIFYWDCWEKKLFDTTLIYRCVSGNLT